MFEIRESKGSNSCQQCTYRLLIPVDQSFGYMLIVNRLYAIDASRRTRVYALNRDRRLEALAPLLLCYSRAHHSIVD